MREKRKRTFRERLKRTLGTIALISVFPGSCFVSTGRYGCGEYRSHKRSKVLVESIQKKKIDLDCITSKRLERKLAPVFKGKTRRGMLMLKEDVKLYRENDFGAHWLAHRVDASFLRNLHGTASSWKKADFWFSTATLFIFAREPATNADQIVFGGDGRVKKAHKLLLETCRKPEKASAK